MAAGFRHGVPFEDANHLLNLHHQGGDSVVRGFIDVSLEKPHTKKIVQRIEVWGVGSKFSPTPPVGSLQPLLLDV